jgi:endoglucanase
MTDLKPFLKSLISAPGLSAHEDPIRGLIEAAWRPLTDDLSVSRLGSLHGLKRGRGPEPRPLILLSAHMDAIGMMVTAVTEGFLRITQVGGLDPRVLPGQIVSVHGRQDLPGLIVQPPAHLLPDEYRDGAVPLDYLLVDTGLTPRQVERLVRVGDLISYAQPPIELNGDYLAGHTLDNRASVAAVTVCLEELQTRLHDWDVLAAATVQEEETLAGAYTSAFELRPAIAVAIDVTFGTSPGSPTGRTFPVGEGVTLGWGPNVHPGVHRKFKEAAERIEIPFKLEPMPSRSGTDAMGLQISADGIPTCVLGIPLKYMHTPVETVALKDIRRAGRLMAEVIALLKPGEAETLSWDQGE